MQTSVRKARALSLLTGAALVTTAVFQPAPAHAVDKKTYKYGAIALGVVGAALIVKGKTVPGAIAAGGAYYAYKKSQKADNNDNRYGYNNYPTDSRYPDNTYSNGNYNNGNYNNGNYNNYPNNGSYNNGSYNNYPNNNNGYNTGYNNSPNNGGNYSNNGNCDNGNTNGGYNSYPNSNQTYYRVQPNR